MPYELAQKEGYLSFASFNSFERSTEYVSLVNATTVLLASSAVWNKGFNPLDQRLVTAAESKVFESLAHLLDPNPRRLKRIVSVYALAAEVAKRVPLSEGSPLEASLLLCKCNVGRSHTPQQRDPESVHRAPPWLAYSPLAWQM